jgi:magnesium chelatase subunit H
LKPDLAEPLSAEEAAEVADEEFLEWCDRLFNYLQVLENRLFSEGLHVLGAAPSNSQMAQYLEVRFNR